VRRRTETRDQHCILIALTLVCVWLSNMVQAKATIVLRVQLVRFTPPIMPRGDPACVATAVVAVRASSFRRLSAAAALLAPARALAHAAITRPVATAPAAFCSSSNPLISLFFFPPSLFVLPAAAIPAVATMSAVGEEVAVTVRTSPVDRRFPTTNQTKHCWARYLEFHACAAAKDASDPECAKFKRWYRSLCPDEWVRCWSAQVVVAAPARVHFRLSFSPYSIVSSQWNGAGRYGGLAMVDGCYGALVGAWGCCWCECLWLGVSPLGARGCVVQPGSLHGLPSFLCIFGCRVDHVSLVLDLCRCLCAAFWPAPWYACGTRLAGGEVGYPARGGALPRPRVAQWLGGVWRRMGAPGGRAVRLGGRARCARQH